MVITIELVFLSIFKAKYSARLYFKENGFLINFNVQNKVQ